MSKDMQYLYGSKKYFMYYLTNTVKVFLIYRIKNMFSKKDKVSISIMEPIQFGRNADILLDAYKELVNENEAYKKQTEFIM
jgi:hypothetical protein